MDSTRTTSEELVLNKIIEVLKTICKIEGGDKYSYDSFDNYLFWKVKVKLPGGEKIIIGYIVPIGESFSPESLGKYDFFIDIFGKYNKNNSKNILSPNQFYDFLINLNGYMSFLDSDADVRNIHKLHINRHIKIVEDFDKYREQPIKKIKELLNEWNSNNHKPILLLADRGMGKTWTSKKFCYEIMKNRENENNYWLHIPAIYISLRKLSTSLKETKSLNQAIQFTLSKTYKVYFFDDIYVFQAFVKTGNIILVLDGIDEMSIEQSLEISNRNLWELFQVIGDANKVILTSRISYFYSYDNIKEHFAYTKYTANKKKKEDLFVRDERRIRRDFNIWQLTEFSKSEKDKVFENYVKTGNDSLIKGADKLHNLESGDYEIGRIEFEITELSKTPALHNIIVKNLNKNLSYIGVYEEAINNAIFRFNLVTDRALDKYTAYDSNKDKFTVVPFKIDKKNNILKNIAWTLFSKGFTSFSIESFTKMLLDISKDNYDVIVNDLRCQTVIKVNEDNSYEFLNKSIFAYYISSYLYDLFKPKTYESFFNQLGYYNLSDEIGLRILSFLLSKLKLKENFKELISSKIENHLLSNRPFYPSNRYIFSNLKRLDIDTKAVQRYNFWGKYPIGSFFKSLQKIINNDFVLIPGKKSEPFYLSFTEITNKDFLSFLNDKKFKGDFWKRYGEYWEKNNNSFKNVINVYHLLFWTKGELPLNKYYHPVVYLSWFAAAMFCNWLTFKLKIYKKGTDVFDYYYEFTPYRDRIYLKEVKINNESYGFRLPDEDEWDFASREGNFEYKYIWDKNGKLSEEGFKLKDRLLKEMPATTPVRYDAPNKFGIYGLWGNVREWVNKLNTKIVSEKDYAIIKGSTWLLGKDGYEIGYKDEVFAQNTNFDVGFRIAKSLTQDEIKLYNSAYSEYELLTNNL